MREVKALITEKRHQLILSELKEKGSVKVADLVEKFNFSESTIRRDLVQLEARHCLKRVHGGAIPVLNKFVEKSYQDKKSQFIHQKDGMAKYAASFVQDGESIYLDSGTTTFEMIKYLKEKDIVVVTNGLSHIEALINHEIPCFILGGRVKQKTKAIIGYEALTLLNRYKFDKCFIGSNGVHPIHGFTTPDPEEALIKEHAIKSSATTYVLVDESKFGEVSFTKFADLEEATIITTGSLDLKAYEKITIVKDVKI